MSMMIDDKDLNRYKRSLSRLHPNIIECFDPPIDFFVNLINDRKHFAFSKLNHAFWEAVIEKERLKKISARNSHNIERLFGKQPARTLSLIHI